MDETYIKVNGAWKYLYRAVDKEGKTADFLLAAKRDAAAARRFFEKATRYILAGIELIHMIRKGQFMLERCEGMSFADQFYALAGQVRAA